MLKTYCLLSFSEAHLLERRGVIPKCKNHVHVDVEQAVKLVLEDTHRFIGGNDTSVAAGWSAIVETDNNREWRNRPSGGAQGAKVRQLVIV